MTVLTAMQAAAIRLQGRRPDNFFGAPAGNVFEMELCDLVNEVAKDIVQSNDWQRLTKFATIHADGIAVDFDLPSDYDRMLVMSQIQQESGWFWGYQRAMDLNEFQYLVDRGFGLYPGVWAMFGGQLHFTPAPTTDSQYPYVSTCYARDSQTLQIKCDFDADTDEFLLDERLITLGLVWRWREQKKQDATGDREAYEKALSERAARDKGSRAYANNGYRSIPGVHLAYPFPLG